jgi:hypothetical protein
VKKKNLIIVGLCILFLSYFIFRNHIRLFIFKNSPVLKSEIYKIKHIDEKIFSVNIFKCNRAFSRKSSNIYNNLFQDRILVATIPIRNFDFRNIVLEPIGSDIRNKNASIYFNTLFFDDQFIATTGIIDNKLNLNDKKPIKKRIGIDKNGKLNIFTSRNNDNYNDVLQAPFNLKINTKTKSNFHTLNYRQFVGFDSNNIIYISGFNNSLISWIDVKEIMRLFNIKSIIALDGGASLDYYFKGIHDSYSFSSVPMRNYWFTLNSPYYIEASILIK